MSALDELTDQDYEALQARCSRAVEAVEEMRAVMKEDTAKLGRVTKQRDEAVAMRISGEQRINRLKKALKQIEIWGGICIDQDGAIGASNPREISGDALAANEADTGDKA